jgi:hypothetical protein
MHPGDDGFPAARFFAKSLAFSCLDNSCLDEYHSGERILFVHRNGKTA